MSPSAEHSLSAMCAAHAPVQDAGRFPAGTIFGDWRLTAFIGRGGNGEVYCAEHVTLGTPAAVKVLARDEERAKMRFEREAKLLAKLKSAAFPRFFAYGEANPPTQSYGEINPPTQSYGEINPPAQSYGTMYLAMELLEPGELPTGDRDVAKFMLKVCEAVGELHALGYVHRDIKPGNILWRPGGPRARAAAVPVLADLGLVKEIKPKNSQPQNSQPTNSQLTNSQLKNYPTTLGGVGTPGYGAPEQMERGEATPASDIHALGVLADRCFNGNPPRTWKRIIRRATSSIPAHRYPSVVAFVHAIRRRHLLKEVLAVFFGLCTVAAFSWFFARIVPPIPSPAVEFSSAYAKWNEISESVISNGIAYTTVNLHSNRHEIAELMTVKGPQVLTIEGPGQLLAAISGSSNVTVRLNGCYLINRTRVPFPQNAIGYILEGESTALDFGFQFYPTNLVHGAKRMGPFMPNDTSGMRMTFRRR